MACINFAIEKKISYLDSIDVGLRQSRDVTMFIFIFHFIIFNYQNYAVVKNHILNVCSQKVFLRMMYACTCVVQLVFVRVVMCAFEEIAHMYLMPNMCLYALYVSLHV